MTETKQDAARGLFFAASSLTRKLTPVMLSPGRARLAMTPSLTGRHEHIHLTTDRFVNAGRRSICPSG